MGTFFRSRHGLSYEQGFVQGAGRILVAPYNAGSDYPAGVEDIVVVASGATIYDIVAPWVEVGFTKTGINITRNNAEEDFDVDQLTASIKRRPSNWEMSVGTQLAEGSFETFQTAWELGPISTVTKTAPQLDERHMGLSAPTAYVERMVAVLFQFPDATIRAWVFRKCVRAAQESGMTLQKTGEQVSLPMRWNAQVESGVSVDTQFGEMFEQIPEP
jgi:hypothetical protein